MATGRASFRSSMTTAASGRISAPPPLVPAPSSKIAAPPPPPPASAASCKISVDAPSLARDFTLDVSLSERISDIIARVLDKIASPDQRSNFHLFALDDHFKAFKDTDSCQLIFMHPYRRFVLQPGQYRRITVVLEGRVAEIDHLTHALLGDLVYLALQCFCLPSDDQAYVAVEPSTMSVARVDVEANAPFYVLKRFNLYCPEIVFSGKARADAPTLPVLVISKLILAGPMRSLLSNVRSRRDVPLELAELSEARIREIFELFQTKSDISGLTTPAEQNALIFLLFGSAELPLLSETLHDRAIEIMQEPSDLKKYDDLTVFVTFLSVETHCFLNEICQQFGGILPLEGNRVMAVGLITQLLFEHPKNRDLETNFVAFLLMVSQWLFKFPPRPGRKLMVFGEKLILFDGIGEITFEGPCDISIDDAKDFPADRNAGELLRQCVAAQAPEVAAEEELDLAVLNAEIKGVYDMLYPGAQDAQGVDFLPSDFEAIFVGQ